jgi:hypothetical protein
VHLCLCFHLAALVIICLADQFLLIISTLTNLKFVIS